jgi:hypothetical protein
VKLGTWLGDQTSGSEGDSSQDALVPLPIETLKGSQRARTRRAPNFPRKQRKQTGSGVRTLIRSSGQSVLSATKYRPAKLLVVQQASSGELKTEDVMETVLYWLEFGAAFVAQSRHCFCSVRR